MGYSSCMCIETLLFADAPNGAYSIDAWKQMVDDTERLVAQAPSS